MKKKVLFLTCVVAIFLFPILSSAECTSIGHFNSFSLEGTNTVTLYFGSKPILRFDVLGCEVQPSSNIQPIKTDVCDGDNIMIDGFKCTMMEIKPLGM